MPGYSNTFNMGWVFKASIVLLVIFMLILALPGSAGATNGTFGDIDGDENINVNDVVLVMRYALGLETLSADERERADVNGDGVVNVRDATLVMQKALELVDQFPVAGVSTETYIAVNPAYNVITGHNFLKEETVTVSFNDVELTVETDENGNFELEQWEYEELELETGQTVVASDGTTRKAHIIRDLKITGVDKDADTVTGYAPAGTAVEVRVYDMDVDYQDSPLRTVVSDEDGVWEADFSITEGLDPHERSFDIDEEVTGEAQIKDLTGDATFLYWHYDVTNFSVYPEENTINGFGWDPGGEVNITVDDQVYEAAVDFHGFFDIDAETSAGDNVEVTDGINVKEHLVTALQVDEADRADGVVTGSAEAGTTVYIELLRPLEDRPGPPTLVDEAEVEADQDGEWSVDFDMVIEDNVTIYIMQEDDDGDRTVLIK